MWDNFSHWVYPRLSHLDRPAGALSKEERAILIAEWERCQYQARFVESEVGVRWEWVEVGVRWA